MLEATRGPDATLDGLIAERADKQDAAARKLIDTWPQVKEAYSGDDYVVKVRDKEIRTKQVTVSLSGSRIRKVALPRYEDHGELLRWLMAENVPGEFPYTAGVFPFKREGEHPSRMFAVEGAAFRA